MSHYNLGLNISSKDVTSIVYVNQQLLVYVDGGAAGWNIPNFTSASIQFLGDNVIKQVVKGDSSEANNITSDLGWIVDTDGSDVIQLSNDLGYNIALGNGDDVLISGNGNDMISIMANSNTISAKSINAGQGNDEIIVNSKSSINHFVFNTGDGQDTITFNRTDNHIQNLDFSTINSKDVYFTFDRTDLVIHYSENDTVTIKDYLLTQQNISLTFEDRTISPTEIDSFVGVQYWVRNQAQSITYNYETDIYYSFPTIQPDYATNYYPNWETASQELQAAALNTFAELAQLTNLTFTYTENPNQANVVTIHVADLSGAQASGLGYMPHYLDGSSIRSDVFIDTSANSFQQFLMHHEIGHALGMAHPFDGQLANQLAPIENTRDWTLLAYNIGKLPGFTDLQYRAIDVAVLQALYGVNVNYNAGDTTYRFNSLQGVVIGDGSGIDTIDASDAQTNATIYLAEGSWSYIGEKSNYISSANQLSINLNSNIENAIGGAFDDVIHGNYLNNELSGGAGHDELHGGYGNDILDGGENADTMIGGKGDDTYYVDHINDLTIEYENEGTDNVFASINYTLTDHLENLTLIGNATEGRGNALNNYITANDLGNKLFGEGGDDILIGGAGHDELNGGSGNNTLIGGLGNDIYYINNAKDKVIENVGEGNDTIYSSVNVNLFGIHVETVNLIGEKNLNATGNSLANTLIGNDGNNILNGLSGADRMQGGLGDDVYYLDNAKDKVVENAGEGNDTIYSTVDVNLYGVHVETVNLTGNANLNATGNSLANTLIGNDGNNILNGLGGADRMQGGKGDDVYYLDNAKDKVIENAGEGNDTIYSTVDVNLYGVHVETVNLTGNANLNATGNSLANKLVGNSGDNILNGLGGNDVFVGGLGSDTAIYSILNATSGNAGNGQDTWEDFRVGNVSTDANADKIDLSGLLLNIGDYTLSNLESFLTVTTKNNDTQIYVDRDGSEQQGFKDSLLLTLKNTDTSLDELFNNNQIIV